MTFMPPETNKESTYMRGILVRSALPYARPATHGASLPGSTSTDAACPLTQRLRLRRPIPADRVSDVLCRDVLNHRVTPWTNSGFPRLRRLHREGKRAAQETCCLRQDSERSGLRPGLKSGSRWRTGTEIGWRRRRRPEIEKFTRRHPVLRPGVAMEIYDHPWLINVPQLIALHDEVPHAPRRPDARVPCTVSRAPCPVPRQCCPRSRW
jgi:hypothetical protein